jgi:hypothetical protein
MRLTATNHSLECLTSSASAIGWHAVYNRLTASDSTALDGQGSIVSASTETIVAAPAVSEQIDVLSINARNNGGAANEITIQKNVGGTLTILFDASLNPGDMLQYSPTQGFSVLDPQGRQKRVTEDTPPLAGRVSSFVRSSSTAAEAAGVRYWPAKDAGAPAAFVVGTPGLSGRAVNGLSAADAGCFSLWAPTGSLWLRKLFLNCSAACSV